MNLALGVTATIAQVAALPSPFTIATVVQAAALPAPFTVTTDGACPTAAAVQTELERVTGGRPPRGGRAHVASSAQGLSIELSAPGEPNRTRTVNGGAACDGRARVAAVVVAIWLGELGPSATPPAAIMRASAPASRTLAEPAGGRLVAGLGVTGTVDDRGLQAGARLELVLMSASSGPNLGLGLAATLGHSDPLGQGTVSWARPSAGLAVGWGFAPAWGHARIDAGPSAGLLIVQGRGYDEDRSARAWSPGAHAGIHLVPAWLGQRTWIDTRAWLWPISQHLRTELRPAGQGDARALPRWEAHVSVGVGFDVISRLGAGKAPAR